MQSNKCHGNHFKFFSIPQTHTLITGVRNLYVKERTLLAAVRHLLKYYIAMCDYYMISTYLAG